MGGGHNCKLARSGAAQRLKLTVRQLASKMATGGCVARSPVLHRAGQKVAYSVSGYLVSCSNRFPPCGVPHPCGRPSTSGSLCFKSEVHRCGVHKSADLGAAPPLTGSPIVSDQVRK